MFPFPSIYRDELPTSSFKLVKNTGEKRLLVLVDGGRHLVSASAASRIGVKREKELCGLGKFRRVHETVVNLTSQNWLADEILFGVAKGEQVAWS